MKRNKRNLSLVILLALGFVIFVVWFLNLHVTEGYVYKEDDGEIFVIYLDESEVADGDEAELKRLVTEGASNDQGDYYKVPFINEFLGTDFTQDDKVRVYWDGLMHPSLPGKVDGVSLIIKLNE